MNAMHEPETCEHCHAELRSVNEACPRCGGLPSALAEARWRLRLERFRKVCRHAMVGTAAAAVVLSFFHWQAGGNLLLFVALFQGGAYAYYGQRLANEDALVPGGYPWVPGNAPLQTRIDWDLWVMVVALAPSIVALWLWAQALRGTL